MHESPNRLKPDSLAPRCLKKAPLGVLSVLAYVSALILIVGVALAHIVKGIPIDMCTRDCAAVGRVPFYAGVISTIGIIIWGATASICLFALVVLYELDVDRKIKAFLLWSFALTSILLIDDAFMIHENSPKLFGFSNNVLMVTYVLLAAYLFYRHRAVIRQTNYILLMVSVAFLGGSVLSDKLHDYHVLQNVGIELGGWMYLVEDGFKLIGIVGWLIYFGWTSFSFIDQELRLRMDRTEHFNPSGNMQ